jgi:hypothetical protein
VSHSGFIVGGSRIHYRSPTAFYDFPDAVELRGCNIEVIGFALREFVNVQMKKRWPPNPWVARNCSLICKKEKGGKDDNLR